MAFAYLYVGLAYSLEWLYTSVTSV